MVLRYQQGRRRTERKPRRGGREIYRAKRVIYDMGDTETKKGDGTHHGNIGNHDGFILAGTLKRPGRKGTGVILIAPAQVYHSRGRD